jgi:glycosidase
VVDGEFKMLDINNPHIFEYVRENDDEKMVVVSNFSDKERTFKTRKEVWNSSLLLSNYDGFSELLRPYETRVYLIKKK